MEQPPLYDFDRICRTCKCEATVVRSVFETFENVDSTTHIHEMLMACAAVQVGYEDGLPSSICEKCVQKLQAAYFFKKQCESSDASLREYAKTIKESDVKPMVPNLDEADKSLYLEKFLNENSAKNKQENESRTDFIELLENNQMILTCRECCKVFTTLEGLKCHKRLHTGALLKCKYCDKEYTRQNHLQRHELSHNRKKVHVCRICNKTLTRLEHLKRHLTTHLKDKPFSCTRCKRGFNRSEHLENHVARCKGDRIHICDICNKGFNRADSLQVHKLLHENQTPVLPTLENLDNIEDHYFEIDYDANTVFSDDNSNDVDGCFEPQVEVTESVEEKVSEPVDEDVDTKYKEDDIRDIELKTEMIVDDDEGETADNDAAIMDNDQNDQDEKDDFEQELKEELTGQNDNKDNEVEAEIDEFGDEEPVPDIGSMEHDDEGSDSAGSEYKPTPKVRKRGRPRKHPVKLPKSSKSAKHRKSVIKKMKKEEEEVGEFPCPSCQEILPTMSILEKHASDLHPGSYDILKQEDVTHEEENDSDYDMCSETSFEESFSREDDAFNEADTKLDIDICPEPLTDAFPQHEDIKIQNEDICTQSYSESVVPNLDNENVPNALLVGKRVGSTQGQNADIPLQGPSINQEEVGPYRYSRQRKNFCIFCKGDVSNFARHINRKHSSESEVVRIRSIKDSREKKIAYSMLRKRGNFLFNRTNLKIRPVKAVKIGSSSVTSENFVPCRYCLGFYKRTTIYKHLLKCSQNSGKNQRNRQSYQLEGFGTDIFPQRRLNRDNSSSIAKRDLLIRQYAYSYLKDKKSKRNVDLVKQNVRRLANLLKFAHDRESSIQLFIDLLRPCHIKIITDGVNELANKEPEKYKSPLFALNFATLLGKCCDLASIELLKIPNTNQQQEDVSTLKNLIISQWTEEFCLMTPPALQEIKKEIIEEECSSNFTQEKQIYVNNKQPAVKRLSNATENRKNKNKPAFVRLPWTDEQKRLISTYFAKHIERKEAPKRHQVKNLIDLYPGLFQERKWTSIKAVVYNIYSGKLRVK